MPNWAAYATSGAVFLACLLLNPSADRHRYGFMDHALNHFFELPRDHQKIFEELRTDGNKPREYPALFYGNFLVFSTLTHVSDNRERRLLSIGALGFTFPIIH